MTNTELTEIRESLSLTKAQLAEKLGITNMLLGRYEKGSCAIPEKVAEAVKKLTEKKTVDEEDVSSLIKTIRESLGLNKSAFARMIGVTPAMIGSYESGKYKPKAEILEKIKAVTDGEKPETAPGVAEKQEEVVSSEDIMPMPVDEEIATSAEEEKQEEVPVDEAVPVEEIVQTAIVIQSLMGGSITPEEILSRVPEGTETVYVKPEENKAYWTKGSESGSIDLW